MREVFLKKGRTIKTILDIGLVIMAVLILPSISSVAQAIPGDFVGSVNFSEQCSSGTGVGITYDGQNLWYSCVSSTNPDNNSDLYRADPVTGVVSASYHIKGGLGALAYDAGRNVIWAGWGGRFVNWSIIKIQLDGTKSVTNATFAILPVTNGIPIDDGIAYDATDDTIYNSPDASADIYHYAIDGTLLGTFAKAPGPNCSNSGLALGGSLLYEGFDGCSEVVVVNKTNPSTPVLSFSTVVAGDPNFHDEGLTCDPNTFAPKEVMWSKEAYAPMRAHAFEVPEGSCGFGGKPPAPKGSISGMKFEDLNANGIRDSGELGLANWMIILTSDTSVIITQKTTTAPDGSYNFTNLTDGNYTVGEVMQSGWIQTTPATGSVKVQMLGGNIVTGKDFGNFHKGKITGGGSISIKGDPRATFGLVGQYSGSNGVAQGNVEYQDHATNLNIKSIQINTVATTLDKKKGVITGLAQVNGAGSYPFVVYVEDNGEPGKGVDMFNISVALPIPYKNGAVLSSGNVQIHQ